MVSVEERGFSQGGRDLLGKLPSLRPISISVAVSAFNDVGDSL